VPRVHLPALDMSRCFTTAQLALALPIAQYDERRDEHKKRIPETGKHNTTFNAATASNNDPAAWLVVHMSAIEAIHGDYLAPARASSRSKALDRSNYCLDSFRAALQMRRQESHR